MAIPRSNLPGHRLIDERVRVALGRCEESAAIDFKQSETWDSLKWTITKTAMAMSNQRDGGVIIIGVAEVSGQWQATGVNAAHLGTFDPDVIIDFINKYASPPIRPTFVIVEDQQQLFLAIQVYEFSETPVVCQRDSDKVKEGTLYVRPAGTARSERAANAAEMHDVLELAAEKRARRIIETGRRVGLEPREPDQNLFDIELGGL